MKKWRRLFRKLFIRHLAAFEEELYPEARHEPPPNLEVINLSIRRHFEATQEGKKYLLAYAPAYEPIVSELRWQGWTVELRVGAEGTLTYHISRDHSDISAHA